MLEKMAIYTVKDCPSPFRSKNLLKDKGHPFEEIDITNDPGIRERLAEKGVGRRNLLQFSINERHVGDYEALTRFFHEM